MMEAPRCAWVGLVLAIAVGALAPAQDAAKAIAVDLKKVDEKIKEESERVARKKETLQVEFTAMMREDTKASLKAKMAEVGAKHLAALKPADKDAPPPSEAVRSAVQDDCRAAVAATVGRNLSTVLDAALASNLATLARTGAPIDYQVLVNESIAEVFDGPDFEANYRKLMPIFEKRLLELQGEAATLKQRLADIDAEAKARQVGAPPGMVPIPGGKVRIGSDAKEFEDVKKLLGFEANAQVIDKYALGWPAHDVEIDEFFIDINEVTHKYWAEFVKDTGKKPPKAWSPPEKKAAIAGPNAETPQPESKPSDGTLPAHLENLPITAVTMDEVAEYLAWCGRRLPTEFEWEAAARHKSAGSKANYWFPWGDTYDRGKAACNNQTAVNHPLRRDGVQLLPVGTFPQGKSTLGINDLAGNAAEMTSSYFTAYPGWKEDKCPPGKTGDPFSASLIVLRGGTALGSELYSLTTTRKAMTVQSAAMIGFRTALSKVRGKDYFQSIAGNQQLAPGLGSMGPPLKDEKSGRAELALHDPARYTALMAGGFDAERQVPVRAQFVAVACRNTTEFSDAARIKSMAREIKKPLMLGYFTTDIDFIKPAIPKGRYWVCWDPGRSKGAGKDKIAVPEGLTLVSTSNKDNVVDVPNVNPVLVPRSTETTKLVSEKQGSLLSVIMTFPVRDRKEARCIVELRLECAPGALSAFK